jgi:tripartite-type tricarboxylate transporter receptor subunit TctC
VSIFGRSSALRALFAAISCAVSMSVPAQNAAATFPSKPMRIIVGFPAGGSSDGAARVIAERMSNDWGSPVIVENKVGAGGTIAAAIVAAAPADGHTLFLIGPGTHAVSSALYSNLPYDPIKSFASVTQIGLGPYFVLVNSSSPIKTVKDLVAIARSAPGTLSYASSGVGSGAHLVAESLAIATGTKLLHVPYKGAAPATVALLSGEVGFAISDSSAAPYIESGTPSRWAWSRPRARHVTSSRKSTPRLRKRCSTKTRIASWRHSVSSRRRAVRKPTAQASPPMSRNSAGW